MTKSKRIEHMTPEQEAALPAFREGWRAVGLSTAPIHEASARSAVRSLYKAGDCEEPKAVITLASPMACLIARAICEKLLNEKLSNNQREVLERQLRDQLGDQLWGQLWDQLGGQLGDQLGDQLFQSSYFIGGQEAFWLAFYEYGEYLGAHFAPRTKAHFDAYRTYALTAGWLYPYKSIAFVSDRPAEIHFDAQRRLHSATGMAVSFRDGWGLHAWHGLRVPARLIEAQEFSAEAIEGENNAEFRRVLLEREYGGRSGFELYAEQRKVKLIAEDELHGFPRRLLEVEINGENIRIIEVVNGSLEPDGARRKFHLSALRGNTPHDVVAASYGIAPQHYREAVRT